MADLCVLRLAVCGKVIEKSDPEFQSEIRKAWNARLHAMNPMVFVKVNNVEDVVQTVRFCNENKLNMCVRGGAISDFCCAEYAVVIDLSLMRKVQINSENKTVTVQGGALVHDVDSVTVPQGFAVSLGSYSRLGVAGHTLIGGQGFLTRSYGYACDNVLEFEIVTADGTVVCASAKRNVDLFWGMKGSGTNLGLVTSITFGLHEIPRCIMGGLLCYPVSRAKEVIKMLRDYHDERNDSRLCFYVFLYIANTGPQLIVKMMYNGPLEEGQALVHVIESLTNPDSSTVVPVPYDQFQRSTDYLCKPGKMVWNTNGNFLKVLKDEVIEALAGAVTEKTPNPHKTFEGSVIYINFEGGGKSIEIPHESSSFPFRQARYWIGVKGCCNNNGSLKSIQKWAESAEAVVASYGLKPFAEGEKKVIEKLNMLKHKYDPNNLFRNNLHQALCC